MPAQTGATFLHPLTQLMSMLLEALSDLAPRIVELDRSLQAATCFVRMDTDNLHPVKLACLFQNFQVVDFSKPERSVFTQPLDVEHLLGHSQQFQQANYVSGLPGASCVPASGDFTGHWVHI